MEPNAGAEMKQPIEDKDHITVEMLNQFAEQLKEDDKDRDRLRLYLIKRLSWLERIRCRIQERDLKRKKMRSCYETAHRKSRQDARR